MDFWSSWYFLQTLKYLRAEDWSLIRQTQVWWHPAGVSCMLPHSKWEWGVCLWRKGSKITGTISSGVWETPFQNLSMKPWNHSNKGALYSPDIQVWSKHFGVRVPDPAVEGIRLADTTILPGFKKEIRLFTAKTAVNTGQDLFLKWAEDLGHNILGWYFYDVHIDLLEDFGGILEALKEAGGVSHRKGRINVLT